MLMSKSFLTAPKNLFPLLPFRLQQFSFLLFIIEPARLKGNSVKIGFTVFAASVPVSLIFLTGDATISPLAVQSSGVSLGWLK